MSIMDYDVNASDIEFADRIIAELDKKLSAMTEKERNAYFKKMGLIFDSDSDSPAATDSPLPSSERQSSHAGGTSKNKTSRQRRGKKPNPRKKAAAARTQHKSAAFAASAGNVRSEARMPRSSGRHSKLIGVGNK